MKIIELTAENIKRLKAVEIKPDAHLQIIGGRNSQGKTSVLDSIWLALGGGDASKSTVRPIRDGEDHAIVRLDLGQFVVTRTWKGENSTLKVESAEGAKYSSPQSLLDDLVGKLSFDPLEFTRLSAKEQLAALLELVELDVDLDALAQQRAEIFEARTEVGRQIKNFEGQAVGLGEVEQAPDVEVSAQDLIARILTAEQKQREYEDLKQDRTFNAIKLEDLTDKIAKLSNDRAMDADFIAKLDAMIANFPACEDVGILQTQLSEVETTNASIRRNAERTSVASLIAARRSDWESASVALEKIDRTKSDSLAAAKFPVAGLGFNEDGVTFNDIPFSQASSAEQIRVSLAMAMSLNPKLRVIRILDGSLLDAENLAMISEMAQENDFQVWVERVGNADGVGVIIEDGEVEG